MPPPVPPKPYVGGLQHPSFNRISPPVPPKPRRAISTMALNHQPPMHNSMLEKENFNYVSQNHLDQSESIIVHQGMFFQFLGSQRKLYFEMGLYVDIFSNLQ